MTPEHMANDYKKGQQDGMILANLQNMQSLLATHIEEQKKINENNDKRFTVIEAWIQNTTGKIVVLSAVFTAIGSLVYIAINWLINHKK